MGTEPLLRNQGVVYDTDYQYVSQADRPSRMAI
jgi:hypothetical protein